MRILLPALALLSFAPAFSQSSFSSQKIRLLDSIATQDVPAKAPGIATAIVVDGKLVYEKFAGYADFTDSSLITRKTRFNIASNGKQFTALAVLSLVDGGKIRLADDIRKYLPNLFPNNREQITIQDLLNHTSGIRDCYDLWSLQGFTWWEKSFSNEDVLKLIGQQVDLNFKPGSTYLYSNTNYILLALIIEKVSGKGFVDFTNEMFRQLGMPSTSFESDYSAIRGPIARSYFNFGSWTTYDWIWNVCGDGNIFSTLEDQVQWESIIQGSRLTRFKRSIIEKSQQSINDSTHRNYGYGLEFGEYKGMDYRFHEGATGAWKATVIRFPSRKVSMLTLTNTGKSIPSLQTRQMADIVFGLKPDDAYLVTKPSSVGAFVSEDEIIGTYLTENDFAFQFERRENKIFLKRVGRNDVDLEREADNIFHQKFDPAFKQEFTRDANGTLKVTAYYINHAPYSLVKQSADFYSFRLNSLEGKFINTETGTVVNIRHKSANTYDVSFESRDNTSTGLLVTPGKLLVDNYTLIFESGSAGISTFYLNGDRIRAVKFTRWE